MKVPPPRYLFILLSVFIVGACTQNPQPQGKPLPHLTYENLNPYRPYGGGVEIRQSFKPDAATTQTVAEFPVAPDELLQRYAGRRFDRNLSPVRMVFDIQKAALSKKSDEENLVGFLSGAAEDYYTLEIAIAMFPAKADGTLTKPYTVSLKRELFIPQRASLAEREITQFEFLEKAVHDIDQVVTKFVTENMR
ncbi:MAG TPA: hypothetical protein PLF01_01030 [Alphaproteobacteria bacterium]|nr:hypothetical protein [Alphaproteobacteria bacterium]